MIIQRDIYRDYKSDCILLLFLLLPVALRSRSIKSLCCQYTTYIQNNHVPVCDFIYGIIRHILRCAPVTANPLMILHRPSAKFELINYIKAYSSLSEHSSYCEAHGDKASKSSHHIADRLCCKNSVCSHFKQIRKHVGKWHYYDNFSKK